MPKIKNVFVYKPEQLPDDYSAMRGPCPKGFHIPAYNEIVALRDMFNTMGLLSGGTSNFISYLKIPQHYRLKGDLTRANDTASTIRMCNENGGIGAWHIMSSSMGIMGSGYNSRGVPIRPFKDISIAPESSRTTVYDGSSTAVGAGVFWDTTNGLISTSDDGLTWITIADKNLGATTVSTGRVGNYITKCGNFYQRGNNYGFTATVSTTSSTKVDTTGYGPGNYYESSTWITTSDSRWFNPVNANLRGGTTGVVPGGTALVEKEVYPGGEYKINEHTIAYYPLTAEANLMDKTGTYNLTNNGGVTFGEYEGVDCASFGTSGSYLYNTSMATSGSSITRTFCFWCRCPQSTSSYYEIFFSLGQSRGNVLSGWYNCNRENSYGESISIGELAGGQERIGDGSISQFYGKRNHICMVWNGSSATMIVNGEIKGSYTPSLSSPSRFYLGVNSASTSERFNGFMSRFIIEDRARVVEDAISDYNKTKRRYGY